MILQQQAWGEAVSFRRATVCWVLLPIVEAGHFNPGCH